MFCTGLHVDNKVKDWDKIMEFIKGIELCSGFFFDIAKPILDKHYRGLVYSAALVGYGSDVLGYDDEVSTDHMWGPRFYLFLDGKDIPKKQEIMEMFGKTLPYEYKGYSVNFSEPDPIGVRCPEPIAEGTVSPLIFVHTFDEYLIDYLGTADLDSLTGTDWLSFSEHRLLALTSGRVFHDGLNMQKVLEKLRFYPEDVKLYLTASNWSLIAEEQAFLRRCYDVGDTLGSIMICGRIADRLMRLAFLYCGRYAPYSKWFGTAFARLPIDESIKRAISCSVEATDIDERENQITDAQKLIADWHNELGITAPVDVWIESYYGRKIKVIFADKMVDAVMEKLSGTEFERYPLIGTLSGVPNFTNAFDDPTRRTLIKRLYSD